MHSFIVCLRLFNTLSAFCRQYCIYSFYFGGRSNHEPRSPFCILAKPVCERAGNIGLGGEAFIVEFIAVSVGVQEFSNQHFRLYILAFDLASRSYRDSCVFLWNVRLPFSKSRYCSFFCLDAKETIPIAIGTRKTRSLRAFFLACARQKPLINICLCSGCADLLYQVCRGGFYRGVYSGIRACRNFLTSISGFVFLPLIWLIPKVRDSCVFLWSGPLPFSKGRYCSFFCLDAFFDDAQKKQKICADLLLF